MTKFKKGDRVTYSGFGIEYSGTIVRIKTHTTAHVDLARDDKKSGGGLHNSWVTPIKGLRLTETDWDN